MDKNVRKLPSSRRFENNVTRENMQESDDLMLARMRWRSISHSTPWHSRWTKSDLLPARLTDANSLLLKPTIVHFGTLITFLSRLLSFTQITIQTRYAVLHFIHVGLTHSTSTSKMKFFFLRKDYKTCILFFTQVPTWRQILWHMTRSKTPYVLHSTPPYVLRLNSF